MRTKPKSVVNYYVDILQELKDTHQNIELFVGLLYIQGQMFLITISNKIKLINIQYITARKIIILNKS